MTAHNEHTGASLTTAGKGSLEKYAQGWEGVFNPKPALWRKVCDDTKCDYRRSAFGDPPEYCEECWVDGGEDALPSAVKALDFHGSQPAKRDIYEELLEGFDALREEAASVSRRLVTGT